MIDYARINEVDELAKKYEQISNNKAIWNIKLGSHPAACEFKLTINSSPDTIDVYVYETIDELIGMLNLLCWIPIVNSMFKVGDEIWFRDDEGGICSLRVASVKEGFSKERVYFDSNGHYVTNEYKLFKSKNDLIDYEIQQLQALKEGNLS